VVRVLRQFSHRTVPQVLLFVIVVNQVVADRSAA
jgi:hypothetical protein